MRSFVIAAGACLLAPAAVRAQNVAVSNAMPTSVVTGEGQSTVVPPNLKTQCPAGRILFSADNVAPPQTVVWGHDLDAQSGVMTPASFDMGSLDWNADAKQTRHLLGGTSDHDLVTLPNGDVLYMTGAFSRVPISPDPGWGPRTFRNISVGGQTYPFGPDARSTLIVFRSTDCGGSFTYVSELDPASIEDGSCADAQFNRDAAKNYAIIPTPPWDMGGSDGQLARVDPSSGNVYLTFQCVGYDRDPSRPGWVMDSTRALNKTLVAVAENRGASWRSLGFMPGRNWRFGIAPLGGGRQAFGFYGSVVYGTPGAGGKLDFTTQDVAHPGWASLSWEPNYATVPQKTLDGIYANVWAFPVIARTPSPNVVVLAMQDQFGAQGYGYHVFLVNRAANRVKEIDPVLPARATDHDFVFHLAAIDPGSGPVMLYWYDFDGDSATATIRGRLITGGDSYTKDFLVSRSRQNPHRIVLAQDNRWWGDYQTAGGFVTSTAQTTGTGRLQARVGTTLRYSYFPMWNEAGGLRYARVDYAESVGLLENAVAVQTVRVQPGDWRAIETPRHLGPYPPNTPTILREPDAAERTMDHAGVRGAVRAGVAPTVARPGAVRTAIPATAPQAGAVRP